MEHNLYIAYLRRSKKEQASNLGIEAQQLDVTAYVQREKGKIINTYIEIESGTRKKLNKRMVLMEAISECKARNATLIIAKLDRLARDVEFTSNLLNTGVKFVACDVPRANEFTIHIMAAVAEQEAKRISERTKLALFARKLAGKPLGIHAHKNPNKDPFDNGGRERGIKAIKEKALNNPNNKRARTYAQSMKNTGMTIKEITDVMNREGFLSPSGRKIHTTTVVRWLKVTRDWW